MERKYKQVAVGIASATVGAAAIGAVQYMFLEPSVLPTLPTNVLGVPMNVLLPILLGAVSISAAVLAVKKKESSMLEPILMAGGAAALGFGVAEYAGWITSVPAARAARAAAVVTRPMTPVVSMPQTKIIGLPVNNAVTVI